MTDQEIIVTIAERVMGWSWVKNCGWADKDRISSLPMYLNYDESEEGYLKQETFNPLTNANHWMLVVERMRKKGLVLNLCGQFDGKWWAAFMQKSGHQYPVVNDNLGPAICEAALKAVEAT